MAEPLPNYPEYQYYTDNTDISVTPWVTDTTTGADQDHPVYIDPPPSPPIQQLQLALMVRTQAILEPYQHTELTEEIFPVARGQIIKLLTTWKDAGILLTWSLDFKENCPQEYTVHITYTHIFSYLSENIAVPLLGHPGWEAKDVEPPSEPLKDSDSKKRLKDLIL